MRLFKEQHLSAPHWRNQRPYVMSEEVVMTSYTSYLFHQRAVIVIWLQHECFPPKGTAMMFLILKVVWESYMSLAKHGSVETLGTKHITHILLVLILLDVSAGLCSSSKFNNLNFLFHWL
jgi:hypothetical protein